MKSMNIHVHTHGFNTLSIEGTKEVLAEFAEELNEVQKSPEGYQLIKTPPVLDGDMTAVELCMTKRIPVVSTRVYRGKPEPLPDKLEFPATVRLGCFRCSVSESACHRLSYALLPAAEGSKKSSYRVPEIICEHCGRPVTPVSFRTYRFLHSDQDVQPKKRNVGFDRSDFEKIARREMRRDMEIAELCTIRAWRKGPSAVVIELTEEGIADLQEHYLEPLLSSPEEPYQHTHFSHLARPGAQDFTELQLWIMDSSEYVSAKKNPRASYDKHLIIAWATCMNLRCCHQFLAADSSHKVDNPTWEDYRSIFIGHSSCPRCRSAYFLSHSGHYCLDK